MFDVLVANKRLPKYQFERRVDIFVSVFLADVLTALFGGTYQLVVPELPLKKDDNHQSTNVDYPAAGSIAAGAVRYLSAERRARDAGAHERSAAAP